MHSFCLLERVQIPESIFYFSSVQRKSRSIRLNSVVKTDEDFSSIHSFNQHNFMYEMKNKTTQPILHSDKIRVWLLDIPSQYQWKTCHFSLKHSFLMGGFENIGVKINMSFCDDIGLYLFGQSEVQNLVLFTHSVCTL